MATLGDVFRVTVRYRVLGQLCMNTYDFKYTVDVDPEPSAAFIASDFWAARKATLRALAPNAATFVFRDIIVRNLSDPSGEYGIWAIPTPEQAGTRAVSTDALPPFNAIGMQLTVGTRVTRPGQKRYAGLHEADQAEGVLVGGVITAAQAVGAVLDDPISTVSIPATAYLLPCIVRLDPSTNLPTADQPVIGYLLQPNVDSQVSRKIGRGV